MFAQPVGGPTFEECEADLGFHSLSNPFNCGNPKALNHPNNAGKGLTMRSSDKKSQIGLVSHHDFVGLIVSANPMFPLIFEHRQLSEQPKFGNDGQPFTWEI